jgi:hypothetical protein
LIAVRGSLGAFAGRADPTGATARIAHVAATTAIRRTRNEVRLATVLRIAVAFAEARLARPGTARSVDAALRPLACLPTRSAARRVREHVLALTATAR